MAELPTFLLIHSLSFFFSDSKLLNKFNSKIFVPKPSPEERERLFSILLPKYNCHLSASQIKQLAKVTKGKTLKEIFDEMKGIHEQIRSQLADCDYFRTKKHRGKEINVICEKDKKNAKKLSDSKNIKRFALYFEDLENAFNHVTEGAESSENDKKMVNFVMKHKLAPKRESQELSNKVPTCICS